MNLLKFIHPLFLFWLMTFLISFVSSSFQSAPEQTVIWQEYEAADNSQARIRIKDEGFGVAEINLLRDEATGWETTEILTIDIIQEYVKIKSTRTGQVFEVFIDWHLGKIILVNTARQETAFWKTTS